MSEQYLVSLDCNTDIPAQTWSSAAAFKMISSCSVCLKAPVVVQVPAQQMDVLIAPGAAPRKVV